MSSTPSNHGSFHNLTLSPFPAFYLMYALNLTLLMPIILLNKPFWCGLVEVLVNYPLSSIPNFATIIFFQDMSLSLMKLHNHLPRKTMFISTKDRNPNPSMDNWLLDILPGHQMVSSHFLRITP